MRRKFRERFTRHRLQRKPLVSDPGMHHAHAEMHVGIAEPRWRGKGSRYSRRMRNPQFYVSGKRPMELCELVPIDKDIRANEINISNFYEAGR